MWGVSIWLLLYTLTWYFIQLILLGWQVQQCYQNSFLITILSLHSSCFMLISTLAICKPLVPTVLTYTLITLSVEPPFAPVMLTVELLPCIVFAPICRLSGFPSFLLCLLSGGRCVGGMRQHYGHGNGFTQEDVSQAWDCCSKNRTEQRRTGKRRKKRRWGQHRHRTQHISTQRGMHTRGYPIGDTQWMPREALEHGAPRQWAQ